MTDKYDLIVIGAGSGGVRAARMAATYGAKVAVVEEYRVGGTCVIRGCVPKKLFVYASRFSDLFEIAGSFGWQVDARFDWPTLLANKDREIDRLENAYVSTLDKWKVDIIRDRAVFETANSVRLVKANKTLEAKHILVATGGHPFKPEMEGAELGFTSNEAFHLKQLPKSVLIYGGGYIALEFATIFAGLGVDTTVCYRGPEVLRGFDDDMRHGVDDGMAERGIKFQLNTTISSAHKSGSDVLVKFADGSEKTFGSLMFATGRAANVKGLGLEKAGVELSPRGGIKVDQHYQTSAPSVYAVGDVVGHAALTPIAIREGAAFAETIYNNNPTIVDYSTIPTAVFTEPEIGTVGLPEHEAAETGDIDVYVARFRPMINTLSDKTERMILKLITQKDGGKVLGCHLLGHGAAEMVQIVAIPMGMGANKADFDRAIALHPSAAEELVTFKAPSYVYRNGKKVE